MQPPMSFSELAAKPLGGSQQNCISNTNTIRNTPPPPPSPAVPHHSPMSVALSTEFPTDVETSANSAFTGTDGVRSRPGFEAPAVGERGGEVSDLNVLKSSLQGLVSNGFHTYMP